MGSLLWVAAAAVLAVGGLALLVRWGGGGSTPADLGSVSDAWLSDQRGRKRLVIADVCRQRATPEKSFRTIVQKLKS
jgi:hypothetical protein